jgi:hypothetical protein
MIAPLGKNAFTNDVAVIFLVTPVDTSTIGSTSASVGVV